MVRPSGLSSYSSHCVVKVMVKNVPRILLNVGELCN